MRGWRTEVQGVDAFDAVASPGVCGDPTDVGSERIAQRTASGLELLQVPALAPRRDRSLLLRRIVVTADVLALATAVALAQFVLGGVTTTEESAVGVLLPAATGIAAFAVGAMLLGLYDFENRGMSDSVDEVSRVLVLTTVALFCVGQVAVLLGRELPKLTALWAPVAAAVPLVFGETGETYDASSCGSTNISTFMNWADAHGVGYAT